MFVGFIGAPNSGKTTIAARVFAELKQNGQSDVEFIAEEARRYIAEQKANKTYVGLTNEDQAAIFVRQARLEQMMVNVTGEHGIVISDSCALNSLWYMSPPNREAYLRAHTGYQEWLKRNSILFFASAVGIFSIPDSLRVHTPQQSKEVEKVIVETIRNEASLNFITPVSGTIDHKVSKVLERIYERLTAH
jgi:predicted ATPase